MNFKRGINIGDHFEEVPIPGEKFKNPIGDEYYDDVKRLGFDHIRLPAKWDAHTDDEHGFKIDPYFLDMYVDSVDKFLQRDLSVIVNIHHFREAMDAPKANSKKIYAIWEQLADKFKDYSDKLVFEVMNEPTWRTTAEEWNEVQNQAVKIIRETNPTREIEVCGIDYSGLFAMDKLVPPKNDENIIGTFHYYFPLEFTHQGAPWSPTYADLHDVRWLGTPEDYENIRKNIVEHAVAWSKKYNLPANLGEFGVYRAAEMTDRAKYTRAVREICEENGISWTYWEYNRNFGIRNLNTDEYYQPLIDALVH